MTNTDSRQRKKYCKENTQLSIGFWISGLFMNMDLKCFSNPGVRTLNNHSIILLIWRWWGGANFICLSLCGTKNRNDTLLISYRVIWKQKLLIHLLATRLSEAEELCITANPCWLYLATEKWKSPIVWALSQTLKPQFT